MAGKEVTEMAEAKSPRERRRSIEERCIEIQDALFVLLMPAAVGSFSFAAIQKAIETPLVAGLLNISPLLPLISDSVGRDSCE